MTLDNDKQNRLRVEAVGRILKDLLKTIKVVTLYPSDNPLPNSLRRSFAERLVDLIEDYGCLSFKIGPEEIRWDGELVYQDAGKEECLAGLFFEAGINRLGFDEAFDFDVVHRFLDLVRDFQSSRNGADLVALLWERQLPGLTYATVEDVSLADYRGDYLATPAASRAGSADDSGKIPGYQKLFLDDDVVELDDSESDGEFTDEPGETPASGTGMSPIGHEVDSGEVPMSSKDRSSTDSRQRGVSDQLDVVSNSLFGDVLGVDAPDSSSLAAAEAAFGFGVESSSPSRPAPDTTLILNSEHKLSAEQEETVQSLVRQDADFDPWESTVELCKEMLYQEDTLPLFSETVDICEKVHHDLIGLGQVREAGRLLTFLVEMESRVGPERPRWTERLRMAQQQVIAGDAVERLAAALNDHEEIGGDVVRRYLSAFGPQALLKISELGRHLTHQDHRVALSDHLAGLGQNNLALIARGVTDRDPQVVIQTISVLSSIGTDESLGLLKRCVDHADDSVREALVRSLVDTPHEDAINLLRQLVYDDVADIRLLAINSIVLRRGPLAFEAMGDLVRDEQFIKLDYAEQQAMLVAYSVLGSDEAVGLLRTFVVRVNLFGDRQAAQLRSAAFEALAQNQGQRAESLLLKLTRAWRPSIKRQAHDAVDRRRQIRYGDENDE